MNKTKCLLTIATLALLSGCGTENFNRASGCGVMFNYPKDFQKKAADQADRIRTDGTLKETSVLVEDYGKTRESIRICEKKRQEEAAALSATPTAGDSNAH